MTLKSCQYRGDTTLERSLELRRLEVIQLLIAEGLAPAI